MLLSTVTRGLSGLKAALELFTEREVYRYAASVSFYAVFALLPLFLIAVALAERGLGDSAVLRGTVVDWAESTGSPAAVRLLEDSLELVASREPSVAAGIGLGLFGVVLGASGVFVEIEAALRKVFDSERVSMRPRDWLRGALLGRLQAFVVVLGTSVMVLATTTLPSVTLLALPDDTWAEALSAHAAAVVAFALLSASLAACYRLLPGRGPSWGAALRGALVAAALLSFARGPFTWVIVNLTRYSAYGVVGALLSGLAWCYVASTLLLFGACLAAPRAPMSR